MMVAVMTITPYKSDKHDGASSNSEINTKL